MKRWRMPTGMRALSPTQQVVLGAFYDAPDGKWSYWQVSKEIPGVHFSRATLYALAQRGLLYEPERDRERGVYSADWQITTLGKRYVENQRGT